MDSKPSPAPRSESPKRCEFDSELEWLLCLSSAFQSKSRRLFSEGVFTFRAAASKRVIAPILSRCAECQESELAEHEGHTFKRDAKTSVAWSGFYGLRRMHGTRVLENSDEDTAAAS